MNRVTSVALRALALSVLIPASIGTAQCPTCPGDVNGDGQVNQLDVAPMAACLVGPVTCACADVNLSGQANGSDIKPFVSLVISGSPPCAPVVQSDYEPGPLETPPAAPCNETRCDKGADSGAINSVYLARGEFYHTAVDMQIRGRGLDFVWARKYRSRLGPNTTMGNGWDHSYNIYLELAGPDLRLHDGNSRQDIYSLQPNNKWARDEFFREISLNGDGTYTLTFADTGKWIFNGINGFPAVTAGRLIRIEDRNGNAINFQYDGQGRIQYIIDSLNRQIEVTYNALNLVASVIDYAGRVVTYSYYQASELGGNLGDLKSVRSPIVDLPPPANHNNYLNGKTTTYTYSRNLPHPSLNSNLLTIRDPNDQVYLTNVYHTTTDPANLNFDRLTRQIWGNPTDIIDVTYVAQSPNPTNNFAFLRVIVNDRGTSTPPATTPSASNVHEYFYNDKNRLVMRHDYPGRAIANQPTTDTTNRPTAPLRSTDPPKFETRWTYNPDALPTKITLPNLNFTEFKYETDLVPAPARRSRGNLRQRIRNNGAGSTITELFTYQAGFGGCGCGTNFVATYTDGRGHTTTHTYDIHGNRTHTDHRTGGGVEDWTYNNFGQMLTHTHPANPDNSRRVDAFAYYPPGPMNGYMQSQTIDDTFLKLKTTYEYDERGNVTRRTHPRGNAQPPNNIPGQDTQFIYNQLDQVVYELSRQLENGARYAELTWYDSNDNKVREDRQNIDENGLPQINEHITTIYEYEILNRVTKICAEKGNFALAPDVITCTDIPNSEIIRTEYSYDPNRNQTQVRNPQVFADEGPQPNDTLDTEYDERDLVYRSIRAKGDPQLKRTAQTDYDPNGNATIQKSALEDNFSRVTTNTYDGFDRLAQSTDPMGNVTSYTYDANGNVTGRMFNGELNDIFGNAGNKRLAEVTMHFDDMDRNDVTQIHHFDPNPAGPGVPIGDGFSTTTIFFGENGQVSDVLNDRNFLTSNTYDTANRPVAVIDAKNNRVDTLYDANSNVINTIETEMPDLPGPPQGFLSSFIFDALDRPTGAMDNIGNFVSQAYDSRDNVGTSVDARGTQSKFTYDGQDRLTNSMLDMDADGADGIDPDILLGSAWNANSQPVALIDGNSHATVELFNSRAEPRETRFADGCTIATRTYDVHGNLVTTVDPRGTTVTYTYDRLNRVTQKSIVPGAGVPSDTTLETFAYDGMGRMVTAGNNASTVTSTYDSMGNILLDRQVAPALGAQIDVACFYDGLGNKLAQVTPARTVTMTYDPLNRLKSVSDNLISGIAFYDYIGPSRVQRRTHQPGTGGETRLDYEYDAARRIIRTLHSQQVPGDIDSRQYGWDQNYNKNNRIVNPSTNSGIFDQLMNYDAANRLIFSATQDNSGGGNSRTNVYTFDPVGNRQSVNGTNVLDQGSYFTVPGCEPADYEMNQYTLTPAGGRTYDANGNLTAWNTGMPDAGFATYDYANRMVSSLVNGVTTNYRYDALGRRIARCTGACTPPGAASARFIYDGWREVMSLGGGLGQMSFVQGAYIDELITMRRGGVNYFYHTDDLFNIVALTNQSGGVVERYEYDDFGRPVDAITLAPLFGNPSSSLISNPCLFNGRRYDPEAGWYYHRTRYLDPRAGRFTTRDIIGIWGDETNFGNGYAFVGNNPYSSVDPMGLAETDKQPEFEERFAMLLKKGVIEKSYLGKGLLFIAQLDKRSPPEEGAKLVHVVDKNELNNVSSELWLLKDDLLVPILRRNGEIENLNAMRAEIQKVRAKLQKEQDEIDAAERKRERDKFDAVQARRRALGDIRYDKYMEEFNKDYPRFRPRVAPEIAVLMKWKAKLDDLDHYIDVHARKKMLTREQMDKLREIRNQVERGTYRP